MGDGSGALRVVVVAVLVSGPALRRAETARDGKNEVGRGQGDRTRDACSSGEHEETGAMTMRRTSTDTWEGLAAAPACPRGSCSFSSFL
jgi:hypothetical protein